MGGSGLASSDRSPDCTTKASAGRHIEVDNPRARVSISLVERGFNIMTGSPQTRRSAPTASHLDLRCPRCRETDAVGKTSELYAASRTTTSVRAQYASSRDIGTISGRATTTTHLTVKLAPPPKPVPWFGLTAAAAGLLVLTMLCSGALLLTADLSTAPVPALLLLFVVLLGALCAAVASTVALYRGQRAKLPEWSRRRAAWERQFYCQRCGVQFVPPAVAASRK